MDALTIAGDGLEVGVAPSVGGGITFARVAGLDFLRPAPPVGVRDPLDLASFPLAPFSNRVRGGRFTFQGREHHLPPNWGGDRLPIHGECWREPWTVGAYDGRSCALFYESRGWWPWAFAARQSLAITEGRLVMELSVENRSDADMPCGLGVHPFFPRGPATSLQFRAASVSPPMADGADIAPGPITDDLRFDAERALGSGGVDHCYDGWNGRAVVRDEARGVSLAVDAGAEARCCVLYVPAGADFFCFEPVTHLNGALNMADPAGAGMVTLAPGQTHRLTVAITPTAPPERQA
ncbi:MAG: aldose 1-epimerase [Caulobacterales bacterium]|nr:aldose 1-epimerase [Caulobacterales bacterium]